MEFTIRPVTEAECSDAAALAALMWSTPQQELAEEFHALHRSPEAEIFVAEQAGRVVGFAQVQLRSDYVEGTHSSPVGYAEGVCVYPAFRRMGVGRRLLSACERWAAEQGCTEFASDCELSNTDSLRFHLASGFREANRIICFVKPL